MLSKLISVRHQSPDCCVEVPHRQLRFRLTEWFASGEATVEQAQELVQQFSVFSKPLSSSLLFGLTVLLNEPNEVINAPTLGEMREGKEVLANEIGVVLKSKSPRVAWAGFREINSDWLSACRCQLLA